MNESRTRDWLLLMPPLFEYPDRGYRERTELAAAAVPPAAREQLAVFLTGIRGRSLADLEEAFIQAFDMNPDCSLDIGWHLFGEDYARGEFLVKLKTEHRRYGVDERSELPDHLPAVLRRLAAMPEEEAEAFARQFISPAIAKIHSNFKDSENAFARLFGVMAACLNETGWAAEREEAVHE